MKCGRPFVSNANFCAYCGATIQMEQVGASNMERVGSVIDNTFRVDGIVGVGSMGVVYAATHLALGRKVALKVLRESLVTDRVVVERFRREALAASRLKHANTINVIHFGQTESGTPYMAMEFLEGRDLSEIVSQDFPIDTRRVVSLISQVCGALDEAHSQGIIHRDIKPANIVVVAKGSEELAKVLDFGIAKLQDIEGEGLTRDGLVCGTPAFMSPEQVSGATVDARSDLFSLGIILYFMLCGRLPFHGKSAVEMASSILMDTPKPPSKARLDARVAPQLEVVCARALEKSPDNRYATAGEFRQALEAAYELYLSEGGESSIDRSKSTSALVQHSAATIVHQPAFVPQRRSSGRKKLLLPIALGGTMGLIAAVLVFVLASGGRDDDGGMSSAASETTPPETLAPSDPPTPRSQRRIDPRVLSRLVARAAVVGLSGSASSRATEEPSSERSLIEETGPELAAGDTDTERKDRRKQSRDRAAQLHKEAKKKLKAGDANHAIVLLKESLELNSRSWQAWETLGDAYLRASRREDAAKAYEQVLKKNPKHPRRKILETKIKAGGG